VAAAASAARRKVRKRMARQKLKKALATTGRAAKAAGKVAVAVGAVAAVTAGAMARTRRRPASPTPETSGGGEPPAV
jgi:hypothetical protein